MSKRILLILSVLFLFSFSVIAEDKTQTREEVQELIEKFIVTNGSYVKVINKANTKYFLKEVIKSYDFYDDYFYLIFNESGTSSTSIDYANNTFYFDKDNNLIIKNKKVK